MAAAAPTPFKISIPQDALDAVKKQLANATLPPPPPQSDDPWQYGVPNTELERLIEHWTSTYDWRRHEAALNADLPQFTLPVAVQDHGIFQAHFVHQRSKRAGRAIPFLFVHGWPGHFAEVRKIMPLLTNPASDDEDAFHVVAPSLPGFGGFSSAPEKAGFSLSQYAEFCHNLMLALGYDTYVVQGGDWGFTICHRIVHLYGAKHVKAWHTNFQWARPPTLTAWPRLWLKHLLTPYTELERKGLERTAWFHDIGQGYFKLQATKPQTLGYALADSPAALLAWIYEKLVTWTDEYPWTDDEVLTWIHLYAFAHTQSTSSAATSVRIYYEYTALQDFLTVSDPAYYRGDVPLGTSTFPHEIIVTPSIWHHTLGHVVYGKRHPRGGHFAAYENPEILVADIRKTFKSPEVRSKF